jgi:hypothetical protein
VAAHANRGEEREVTVRESLIYGPVIGHIMWQPKPKVILNKLDICKTRLMEAIDTLRRHGFLWLNVHGITATGEYQVRFSAATASSDSAGSVRHAWRRDHRLGLERPSAVGARVGGGAQAGRIRRLGLKRRRKCRTGSPEDRVNSRRAPPPSWSRAR